MKKLCLSILFSFSLLFAADAGVDQTVMSTSLVQLDGSNSQPELGGEISKYHWRQVSGKKVKLNDF